jgi:hypothetical protein
MTASGSSGPAGSGARRRSAMAPPVRARSDVPSGEGSEVRDEEVERALEERRQVKAGVGHRQTIAACQRSGDLGAPTWLCT